MIHEVAQRRLHQQLLFWPQSMLLDASFCLKLTFLLFQVLKITLSPMHYNSSELQGFLSISEQIEIFSKCQVIPRLTNFEKTEQLDNLIRSSNNPRYHVCWVLIKPPGHVIQCRDLAVIVSCSSRLRLAQTAPCTMQLYRLGAWKLNPKVYKTAICRISISKNILLLSTLTLSTDFYIPNRFRLIWFVQSRNL